MELEGLGIKGLSGVIERAGVGGVRLHISTGARGLVLRQMTLMAPFLPRFCMLGCSWASPSFWVLLCFLNSAIKSGAFMFSHGFQESRASEYPFQ